MSFKVSLDSKPKVSISPSRSPENSKEARINMSNNLSPYDQQNNKTVYAHVSKGSFEIIDTEEFKNNLSAQIDGEISTLIQNKRIIKKTDRKKKEIRAMEKGLMCKLSR